MPAETELETLTVRLKGDSSDYEDMWRDAERVTTEAVSWITEQAHKAEVALNAIGGGSMSQVLNFAAANNQLRQIAENARTATTAIAQNAAASGVHAEAEEKVAKSVMRGMAGYRMGYMAMHLMHVGAQTGSQATIAGLETMGHMAMRVGMAFGKTGIGLSIGIALQAAAELYKVFNQTDEAAQKAFGTMLAGSHGAAAGMEDLTKKMLGAEGKRITEGPSIWQNLAAGFQAKPITRGMEGGGGSADVIAALFGEQVARPEEAVKQAIARIKQAQQKMRDYMASPAGRMARIEFARIGEESGMAERGEKVRDDLAAIEGGFSKGSEAARLFATAFGEAVGGARLLTAMTIDLNKATTDLLVTEQKAKDALTADAYGWQQGTNAARVFGESVRALRAARDRGLGNWEIDELTARFQTLIAVAERTDAMIATEHANQKIKDRVTSVEKLRVEMTQGKDAAERYAFAQELIKKGADPGIAALRAEELRTLQAQEGAMQLERQTKELENQARVAGMSTIQAKQMQMIFAEMEKGGGSFGEAWARIADNVERTGAAMLFMQTVKIDQQVVQMENHARVIGRSEVEAKKLSMVLAAMLESGQTEVEVRKRIADQLERAGRVTMIEKGAKVFEETRTPMEKYGKELNDLDELLNAGTISQDTYARAAQNAANKTINAAHANSEFKAAIAGSAEAIGRLSAWQDRIAAMSPSATNAVAQMARAQDAAGRAGVEMNPVIPSAPPVPVPEGIGPTPPPMIEPPRPAPALPPPPAAPTPPPRPPGPGEPGYSGPPPGAPGFPGVGPGVLPGFPAGAPPVPGNTGPVNAPPPPGFPGPEGRPATQSTSSPLGGGQTDIVLLLRRLVALAEEEESNAVALVPANIGGS